MRTIAISIVAALAACAVQPRCERVNSTVCDYDYPGANLEHYECDDGVDLTHRSGDVPTDCDCYEGDGLICCAPNASGE